MPRSVFPTFAQNQQTAANQYLQDVVEVTNGNQTKGARLAGMDKQQFGRKLKEHNLLELARDRRRHGGRLAGGAIPKRNAEGFRQLAPDEVEVSPGDPDSLITIQP